MSGCSLRHIDLVTQFHVTSNVLEKKANNPLDGVTIYFVDTGFDSVRSKKRVLKEIGKSDSKGNVNITFDYWWGCEEGMFADTPTKTFDIEFSKDNYNSAKRSLKSSELACVDNKCIVVLKNIYLSRVGE